LSGSHNWKEQGHWRHEEKKGGEEKELFVFCFFLFLGENKKCQGQHHIEEKRLLALQAR